LSLRLRGGHAAPALGTKRAPTLAFARPMLSVRPTLAMQGASMCAPPSRQQRVTARVEKGLAALSRGGVFGASGALARLRGGTAARSISAGAPRMAAVEEASTSTAPECVSGGGEMAPQYAPAEVEQELYRWWEASGYFKPPAYKVLVQ